MASGCASRRAATNATEQDAIRDSHGSARLVSTMGTRAPSTIPALDDGLADLSAVGHLAMLRIDVARHCGEQLDVGGRERALDARPVADGDLVEGAVAQDLEVL